MGFRAKWMYYAECNECYNENGDPEDGSDGGLAVFLLPEEAIDYAVDECGWTRDIDNDKLLCPSCAQKQKGVNQK